VSQVSSIENAAVSRTAAQAPAREYLSFRLGTEDYGIDILRVQEIRGYEAPTRMAGAPEFVRGVLNLRGVIVPIVDLRMRFGIEPRLDALTVSVILNVNGRTVGVVVDSVSDVMELAPAQIKPAPAFGGTLDTDHIIGIASVKNGDTERMIILLDITQLMSQPELGLMALATD
jgi:purine-binding chemotaxis protein CheW